MNPKRSFLIIYDLLPVGILVLLMCFYFQGLPEPAIKYETDILIPDSSNSSQTQDIVSHNASLLMMLLQREATDQQTLSSALENQGHSRNIYFVVVAVILTIAYTGKAKQKAAEIVLLIFIAFMWYLDVHLEEQLKRSEAKNNISHKSVEFLVNKPNLATWYKLDYKYTQDQLNKVSQNSISRKMRTGAQFSLERTIFYFLPWGIIYFLLTFHLRKRIMSNSRSS